MVVGAGGDVSMGVGGDVGMGVGGNIVMGVSGSTVIEVNKHETCCAGVQKACGPRHVRGPELRNLRSYS